MLVREWRELKTIQCRKKVNGPVICPLKPLWVNIWLVESATNVPIAYWPSPPSVLVVLVSRKWSCPVEQLMLHPLPIRFPTPVPDRVGRESVRPS